MVCKVTCAGIEMRLEHTHDTLAGVKVADTIETGDNFLGMVGIVVYHHQTVGLDSVVEASLDSCVCFQAVAQMIFVHTQCHADCSGSDGIFDIVETGIGQFHVVQHTFWGAQIKEDVAIVVAHIPWVVVRLNSMGSVCENRELRIENV